MNLKVLKSKKLIPTIKQKVTQISAGAFVIASAVMLVGFILYSITKREISTAQITSELKNNINSQIDEILPSFFLPEQMSGVELILARYKEREALTDIRIIYSESELPVIYSSCLPLGRNLRTCASEKNDQSAIVAPITESGKLYGYLLKTKTITSSWINQDILKLIGVFFLILATVFISVYVVVLRLFSKVLPKALDNLIEWIEADLENKSTKLSLLPFKELQDLQSKISDIMERHNRTREEAIIGNKIKQVAHDIRSPLEVLKSLQSEIQALPEESKRKVQMCISRIEEIALNLLRNNKGIFQTQEQSEELFSLVESIWVEKKIEFREINVNISLHHDPNELGLFSIVKRGDLKSIISNLINNSIESFNGNKGIVSLSVTSFKSKNIIKVSDDGHGIPLDIMPSIFTKDFTTKKTGNGIGLYNAKQDIEAVGGTIEFESKIGIGTTFTISLPKSEVSKSFIGSIDSYKYDRIIVLDDDPAFHEVWRKRLEGLESKVEHIHSVEEMFSKYPVLHPKILLLSDFELMDKHLDGIDTIVKLGHSEHSVLVTARNEEKAIQDRCLAAGIKLLPKSLVNYVKVVINASEVDTDSSFKVAGDAPVAIILVDDDRLIHLNWNSYCKTNGLHFHGFYSIQEFLARSSSFDKASRIFIDSNLGDGIKGEIESEKIFILGFVNLYLATGYEKDSIQKPSWIKEIYSKSPESIDS
jgi:signal transduction histidine kinase/FixJ family two-component response regulator